jgi:hypothetical protein
MCGPTKIAMAFCSGSVKDATYKVEWQTQVPTSRCIIIFLSCSNSIDSLLDGLEELLFGFLGTTASFCG